MKRKQSAKSPCSSGKIRYKRRVMTAQKGEMMIYVPTEEQETTISMYRCDDKAEIYTSDSTMMTKLDKLVKGYPETWSCDRVETVAGETVAKWYSCPKRLISFRSAIMSRPGGGDALRKWHERQRQETGSESES